MNLERANTVMEGPAPPAATTGFLHPPDHRLRLKGGSGEEPHGSLPKSKSPEYPAPYFCCAGELNPALASMPGRHSTTEPPSPTPSPNPYFKL